MNPVLEAAFRTGTVIGPHEESVPLHSAVSREEGLFIQRTVTDNGAQVVLEVGLAFGISALFICEALAAIPGSRLIAIDPNQFGDRWMGIGMSNLKKARYETKVELISETSQRALPKLVESGLRIDFAFIDGWHTFDHALVDFFYVDQLLRVGGVVALDDVYMPSLRKLARFIATNRSYKVDGFLAPVPPHGLKPRLKRLASRLPSVASRILRPELVRPDASLGWMQETRCVAFKKESDDVRDWDFHRPF
ncbi:MAG: class I SAM-dependent methyltransferase [Candidatus Dormibacteraeota bacterium]|nr:class I SAM-dependent methyltransferase [Candidatus Dormibacteraeota bacterium]